jgi:hypothetical protein
MKKLLIVILAFTCYTTAALCQLPYRPLSEFNGDKGAYLKYNFEEREDLFIGHTFAYLLSSSELPPTGHVRVMAISKNDNNSYMIGIYLYFSRKFPNSFNPFKDDYLTIYWETPFTFDDLQILEKQFPANQWVPEHYNYFKDKKIKMIRYRIM